MIKSKIEIHRFFSHNLHFVVSLYHLTIKTLNLPTIFCDPNYDVLLRVGLSELVATTLQYIIVFYYFNS